MAQRGTAAVRQLRIIELRRGHAFMINSKTLPSNHFYLEYPEGRIVLSTFKSGSRSLIPVRELSDDEALKVRSKFNFDLAWR